MPPSIAVTEAAAPELDSVSLPAVVDRGSSILLLTGLDPQRAEALAGTGAIARPHPLGAELRAARAGVPVVRDGQMSVGPHRIPGDVDGRVDLLGGAFVEGGLRPGAALRATGSVAVDGVVERAVLAARRSLRLEERAVRADIRCGVAEGIDSALFEALAGTGAALREIAAAAYAAGPSDRARRDAIDEMAAGPTPGSSSGSSPRRPCSVPRARGGPSCSARSSRPSSARGARSAPPRSSTTRPPRSSTPRASSRPPARAPEAAGP